MQLSQFFLVITLNSLIFMGVLHAFQGLKRASQSAQIFLKNQEIHSLAFQYLKQDIQSAGYLGCRTRDPTFPLYTCYSEFHPEFRYYRFNQPIYGFKANIWNCLGKMPETACNRVLENSSVLIVYNIPQKILSLTEKLITPEHPINVKEAILQKKSLALISDCQQGDLFMVTELDKNQIFHQKILGLNRFEYFSKSYDKNAEVTELQTVAYYLAKPTRLEGKEKNDTFSLFRDDFLHPAEEIITDILNVEFKYGVLIDNETRWVYKNAEDILDWQKVSTVQIKMKTEYQNEWEIEFALRNKNTRRKE